MPTIQADDIIYRLRVETDKARQDINRFSKDPIKLTVDEASISKGVTNAFGKLAKVVGGLAIARQLGVIGKSAITAAADFERTALSFEIFTGSAENARGLLAELERFSLSSPFTPEEVNNAAKTLLGFGRTAQDVVADLEILGNVSSATGTDINQLGLVFGQVAGVGKLQGQDALQFINAGIPLYQLLSESIGVSVGEVKELQTQGKITFDVLRDSFVNASAEGGKFAGALVKSSQTIEGLFSTLQGVGNNVLRSLGEAFLPLLRAILPPLIELSFKVADGFKSIARFAQPFTDLVRKGVAPLGRSLGRLFQSISGGTNFTELFRVVLTRITRAVTSLSNTLSFLVDGFIGLVDFFRGNAIGELLVAPFVQLFNVVSNAPAILNGVVEAIKQIPEAAIASFSLLVNSLQQDYEKIRAFFGSEEAAISLNALQLEQQALLESEGVIEAFRRGFNEINDIEVTLPEIDTPENKDLVFDSGKEIGEEFSKGLEEGVRIGYDSLGKRIKELQKQLQDQVFNDDLVGANATAEEIKVVIRELNVLDEQIASIARIGDDIEPLAALGLDFDSLGGDLEFSRFEEVFDSFRDKVNAQFAGAVDDPSGLFGLSDEQLSELEQRSIEALELSRNFLDELFKQQEESANREIGIQENRIDKLREVASRGNANQLELEEQRLDELNQKREEALERQRALASLEILINQATAISNTAVGLSSAIAQPFPANLVAFPLVLGLITQIGSASLAAGNLFSSLPAFWEGTEGTIGDVLGHSSKRDSHVIRADSRERIINPELSDKVKGLSTSEVVRRALAYNSFNPIPTNRAISSTSYNADYRELVSYNKKLVQKVENLTGVIGSLTSSFSINEDGLAAISNKSRQRRDTDRKRFKNDFKVKKSMKDLRNNNRKGKL